MRIVCFQRKALAIAFAALWLFANNLAAQTPQVMHPYERASVQFAMADLIKPKEDVRDGLAFRLAPFIVQETGKSNGADFHIFGGLSRSNHVIVETNRPAIYFHEREIFIGERALKQLSYIWCYPPSPAEKMPAGLQGFRVTLNSSGHPVIWEALTDNSGSHVLYVSESLEAAAASQHGDPLSGRRFALEPDATAQPNVVVARVIADGPAAMGPMVHIRCGSRDIATLICRCMPIQTEALAETRYYELLPFSEHRERLGKFRAQAGLSLAFWPEDTEQNVERRLRLPAQF